MEEWVLTKRWLACLLGAAVLLEWLRDDRKANPIAVKAPAPPPPAAGPCPSSTAAAFFPRKLLPAPDATDALVKQVDALYASGMSDFRAGNLEKSKQEFDQALATLLESGLDIQGDERLSSEFDKIVENVYSVEAASLERRRRPEPTQLRAHAPGILFRLDLPRRSPHQAARTAGIEIGPFGFAAGFQRCRGRRHRYLQNHSRGYIENVLRGKGTYGEIIGEALRKQGVPQDLIYLAAGESAFNPFAVSNKQCVGIWQFSQGTGALYGLKKDRWVDERKDPV